MTNETLSFEVTPEEQARIQQWLAETDTRLTKEEVSTYQGAIGGRLTYRFTDTSLGRVFTVHDSVTNEELDLTNYDAW